MSNHRSDDINWLFKKKRMEEHWKKVILSKPVIDDAPPTNYLKSEKVRHMKQNEKKYAKQDIQRRDRIDLIVRRTDELSPQVLLSQIKTIRQSRFSQLQTKIRVKKENKTFFHRIKNTNPIYNLHDMRAHEKEHMSRMKYLAKSKLEINDYGKGSRNFGLLSAYGEMKRDYFDSLPFYTDISGTADQVERLQTSPSHRRGQSFDPRGTPKIPWDESYVMGGKEIFRKTHDSWQRPMPSSSSNQPSFRKRPVVLKNPDVNLSFKDKMNRTTDGFEHQDSRKRRKEKVPVNTNQNLNNTIDKSDVWAPLSMDKSIGGTLAGVKSTISEIKSTNKSIFVPDVTPSTTKTKNSSIVKSSQNRSPIGSSDEFNSHAVRKDFNITSTGAGKRKKPRIASDKLSMSPGMPVCLIDLS